MGGVPEAVAQHTGKPARAIGSSLLIKYRTEDPIVSIVEEYEHAWLTGTHRAKGGYQNEGVSIKCLHLKDEAGFLQDKGVCPL